VLLNLRCSLPPSPVLFIVFLLEVSLWGERQRCRRKAVCHIHTALAAMSPEDNSGAGT